MLLCAERACLGQGGLLTGLRLLQFVQPLAGFAHRGDRLGHVGVGMDRPLVPRGLPLRRVPPDVHLYVKCAFLNFRFQVSAATRDMSACAARN